MATLKSIRRDDRGQLLLVGAFILAILLVALAVVLNAAIYTETYAAHGNDRADVSDTVQYRADTERALEGLVITVNDRQYVTRDEARANLTAGIDDLDAISAREQASTGRATSVSFSESDIDVLTNVSQTNVTLAFTNNLTEPDWTVVKNVAGTESFTVAVVPANVSITESNVKDATVLESRAFHVKVNDSTTLRVFVFETPGDTSSATVAVDSGGSVVTYNVTYDENDPVEIDFVNASIDGTPAPALESYGGISGPYNVSFVNGNQANGTYTLVVDGDVANTTDYAPTSDDGPTARAVVTQLDVTLRYEMPNLSYETPITVTVGGADDV